MERRKLIVAAGTVFSAGCIGPFADDEEGDNGDNGMAQQEVDETPEEAITRFINALDEGDLESVNGMLHPDGMLEEVPEEQGGGLAELDMSIESTEVVEEEEERAVVTVSIMTVSPEGEEVLSEDDWELRVVDGEWRVWDGNIGAN